MSDQNSKSAQLTGKMGRCPIKRIALLSHFCLAITVFFLISLYPAAEIYGEEVLRVGVYNNKPTIFEDTDGKAKGLFIDILEEIAVKEGWKLEYVYGHFSEVFDELKAGTIDLLPAIAYVEEREQFVD